MVGKKYKTTGNLENHSLAFISSLIYFAFVVPKSSHVKSLEIFIPAGWLRKEIGLKDGADTLSIYMDFKNRKGLENLATPALVRQFKEIVSKSTGNKIKTMKEDVNSLLHDFISDLITFLKEALNLKKVRIVNDEVNRLLEVKNYLVKDLSLLPEFPYLKKVAAMSGITLKQSLRKCTG